LGIKKIRSISLLFGFIFLASACRAENEGSFVLEKKRLQPVSQQRSIEAVRDAAPDLWVSLAGDEDNLGFCREENWFHIELQNPEEERWSHQIIGSSRKCVAEELKKVAGCRFLTSNYQ
jgi:hypothetical protein